MEPHSRNLDACQLIDNLGGTSVVANIFDIDPGAVSQWRRNGIPKPRMQFLRLARPDLFHSAGVQKHMGAEATAMQGSRNYGSSVVPRQARSSS